MLELGAGPGAATAELRRLADRVTSLEYDRTFAAGLHTRAGLERAHIVQGDAAALPFSDNTFSSVIAVLVLHHLISKEKQDQTFAEVRRVLRPGGIFLTFEIPDSWLNRAIHLHSTFVPVDAASVSARFEAAGFASVAVKCRRGGMRIRALRSPKAESR